MVDIAHSLEDKLKAYSKPLVSGNVKVGFLGGHFSDKGISYAAIAAWNEFGVQASGKPCEFYAGDELIRMYHAGMPARPFFSTMINKEKGAWAAKLTSMLKANHDTLKSLQGIGDNIKDSLRESIIGWSEPPNAPITIKKKGKNDPLVDTGNMGNTAIEVKVEKGLS